jgi:hypothetical protein
VGVGEPVVLSVRFEPRLKDQISARVGLYDEYGQRKLIVLIGTGLDVLDVPITHDAVTGESLIGSIVPNPARGRFTFGLMAKESSHVRAELIDLNGGALGARDYGLLEEGYRELSFDAEGIPSGHYLLIVSDGRSRRSRPLIIER